MKKSYFWGLLLAIMALIPSQNAFADYCTMSSTFSNSDRHLDSFTLTDGVEELAVSSVQPNSGSTWRPSYKVYNDHTSKSLTTQPGATLHFKSLSWTGSWMHGYVFIDYNQDETFDESEAVSYNFYSAAGESTGVNSKGESVSNNCGVTAGNMPSWTLPTDLASGTYRLRFKIDWNSLDACGASSIVSDRGCIADITLNVEAAIPERTIDVTVTPEGAGTVTGAGTAMGNITLTATATPGYEFVNWTLNGEVVGTDMSYTDATEGNKSYVANFAVLTAYPEMSYLYTNGMNQANRYLQEVVATAGETVTTVFSAATEAELPKVDPDVTGSVTKTGAYVDKTENPIIIPEGTTEFTVNFKAWTTAMTIGGASATTQLNWTQQAVFIDWNNNFYFYEEGENYGKNGDGMPNADFIAADGFVRTFSVPADVKPGVYRMRVCYYEPDGNNAQQWQNTIFEKGNCTTRNGKTYDFAIEVQATVAPSYEVTVSVNDEAMGTAKKVAGENDEFTLTATAKEGYEFVNWTVAGAEVSAENPYVFTATENAEVVANFQLVAQWPATMTLINTAKELIVKDGVGYPSATAKATFKEALDAAEANTTIASLAPLQEAINTYYAVTEIEMPVAGNVYAFIGKGYTSASDCYLWNNNGVLSIASYTEGETVLPETAYFSCEIVDGQYMFKTIDGQYYMAYPSPGKNWLYNKSENGLEPTVSNLTKFDILKIVQTTRVQKATTDLFGQVYMWGCRGNGDSATGDLRYGAMIVKSGSWDGAGEPYCDSTPQSSAFSIVKVDYNTTPVYTVTVNAGVGGTAEASATEAEEGTEVTFTATAEEGYAFVCWTAGTDTVSVENPYTTVVNANVELTANFELLPVKYTVTVNAGVGGTAEASATEVEEGTEVTLTATAAEGYAFAGWTTPETTPLYYIQNYNTKKYLGYNSSNLAAIDEQTSDVTIAPSTMNEGEFTFFLTNATYDQQTPPQAQSYLHCGSSGRFSGNSVNTSASQQIAVFKVEDPAAETITATQVTEITSGATYMFVGLKNGVYYALTDELYKEGTTDQRMVGAEVTITDGTISFVPGTSSALWTITNKAFESTENPYTVTVTANAEFTANFVEVPVVKYAVSVTTVDATMGTAEVSATEVKEGEEATFTATANLGYKFIGWLSNGETVSTENPYTTAVTAEMALVANFEALTPAIVLTATPDVERQFSLEVAAEAKILIDWGNGELKETETIGETYPGTSWIGYYATTVNGTPVGEGVVKIYGDITYFDCSYSSAYPSKVTTLDVTNATSLLEVNISSNEIATLDLSNNTALYSLTTDNNATLTTLVLPETNQLNILSAQNCSLSSLDLSSCASLTSLNLNENSSLGAIDVTSLTALKTFNANNTGLTTIDLSASSKITTLRLNNNQLTSLDISGCAANVYVWADNNKLTELVVSEGMKNTAKVSILNNNFTLATLPALSVLTDAKYIYAPQAAMTIAAEITEGEELDLSAQTNIVGRATEAQATDYTWYTAEGEEFTSYTEENGKFVFNVDADTELYCAMTTAAFPSFSGANAFKTTNIVVKNIPADENTLALIESAKALIEKEGLGYPSATAKATFQEAIDAAEANPTAAAAAPLQAAMNEYYATSDIVRPEAGNVYAFISKGMYYNYYVYNNAGTLALASYTAGAELPDAAKFVCEFDAEAGKYLFKTVDGMYYMAYPSPGKGWLNDKSETGLETTARKVCQFDIDKITIDANVSATAQDLFGYVHLWGYRGNETKNGVTSDFNGPMIVKSTGAWDGAGGDYYNASTSSVFSIVEVEYVAPVVTYTVTVANASGASATNGTVAIEGFEGTSATVEEGTEVTIVATPAEGYQFISWADAMNTDVSTEATYTFTVNGNVYLEAWFEAIPVTNYTVNVVVAPTADCGTVAIEGFEGASATVEEGTNVTVVATAAEGYEFEGWYSEMGEELSTEATYTFAVSADVTVQAWFAEETPVVVEYCTYEGNSQHSERRLNALTITDGTNTTAVSSIQPNFRGAVYVDKTDVEFPSYAGASVSFSEFDFKGEWMHAYVYVDYDNDGTFNTTVNADGTTGGELVSFTFYSATDAGTGVNSLGETVSNYTIPMVDYLPAFTLPADLEEGSYRVRVKIDWSHLDPCGHPSESANKLTTNGGCIADFTMTISEADGVEFTEAEVAQVYAADGVIYINGYEGDVKVVNVAGQVIKDVNVNGNETLEVAAGLYIVVTGDQVTKVVVK